MVLMVKSWWFVIFVMVFVVETIRICCDGFYWFFIRVVHTHTKRLIQSDSLTHDSVLCSWIVIFCLSFVQFCLFICSLWFTSVSPLLLCSIWSWITMSVEICWRCWVSLVIVSQGTWLSSTWLRWWWPSIQSTDSVMCTGMCTNSDQFI